MTGFRRRRFVLTLLALLGPAALAVSPACPPQLRQQLDTLWQDADHPMASLAVVVIRQGKVAFSYSGGYQHIDADQPQRNLPATPRTMLRIASVSKLVTTLGVMKLVEQGKLALDEDISRYLGYPVRNPRYPDLPITLRMVLSHTATLSDEGGYFWPVATSLQDIIGPAAPAGHWLAEGRPGEHFAYSNLGWGVLGTVMEKVSGERFDKLMRRLILDPLAIRGDYNPAAMPARAVADIATLYSYEAPAGGGAARWLAQRDDYTRTPPPEPEGLAQYQPGRNATPFSPTGGLRISALELARIMQVLLNRGVWHGKRILSPASIAAREVQQWRYTPAAPNGDTFKGGFLSWGLGVQRYLDVTGEDYGDRLLAGGGWQGWGHMGFASGALTGFFYRPEQRDGLIYLISGTKPDTETYLGPGSSHHAYQQRVLTAAYQCLQPGRPAP